MVLHSLLPFLIVCTLIIAGAVALYNSQKRSAVDVFLDLEADVEEANLDDKHQIKGLSNMFDEYGKMGLRDAEERRHFQRWQIIIPASTLLIGEAILFLCGKNSVVAVIMIALLSWAIGYIFTRYRIRGAVAKHQNALEYNLPLVMERLVMAVEAGLDIIAAVQTVVELEKETAEEVKITTGRKYKIDPVTDLLAIVMRLSDAGLRFEKCLSEIAKYSDNSAIKHAFIHLALAQKEGGELIMPLRELSDATQIQYQETIEESIAKMPVKATIPLVFTFAGLILFMLTAPISQILKITTSAMPH